MDSKILKGFRQVNGLAAGFDVTKLEEGFIYLVRTSEDKEEGYVYFNGKKYGNVAELREEMGEQISAVTTAIETEVARAEAAEEGLQHQIDLLSSGSTEAVEEEAERAKAAEKANADAIEAEETRAEAAEEDLQEQIDALASGAVADIIYTKDDKEIKLVNEAGETVGTPIDVTDFIVDGMLSSVTYDASAHTMTFHWNTEAGIEETTIDISELIDPAELEAAVKAEADRAKAAEKANADAIEAETTRAEGVEDDLQRQIDLLSSGSTEAVEEEAERAKAAEEALEGAIADEAARAEAAEEALSGKTNELQEQIDSLTDADVTVSADIVISGETVAQADETVHSVLEDIYTKLSEASEVAYTGVTSTGNTIVVTETENGHNIEVNTEVATDDTVADGHIELQKTDNGELYGVMYYGGDDIA